MRQHIGGGPAELAVAADSIADDRFVGELAKLRHVEPDAHEDAPAGLDRFDLMRGAAVEDRVIVAELNVSGVERQFEFCLVRHLVDQIE